MKIGARKCDVVEISNEEATTFLIQYHRQKAVSAVYNIGLKYNNELIGLMTFGYPRYNLKYQWELLRLCFKSDCRISGGTQKLFQYFIDTYNPHSIVSYCDYNYFTGDIYDKLGFTKIRVSKGSKIWYKDDKFITDNLLRQYGADKLIGTHDGKGTNNEEIMLREGWQYKIDEKGQGTYIWNGEGKFGYIYLITDTLHNKQYIGQHRGYKLDEKYYGTGTIIKDLIKTHGTEILKREIIDYASSQEELSKKEIEYIKQYNTLWPNGYNLTLREQAIEPYTRSIEITEETRQKLAEASKKMWQNEEYREKQHTNLVKALDKEEYKEKRRQIANNNWNKQTYREKQLETLHKTTSTTEYKEKMRNSTKELWKKDDYRNKCITAIKIATQTKEFRQKRHNQQLILSKDPQYLKKVSEGVRKRYNTDPNYKLKLSLAMKGKKRWNNGIKETFSKECPGEGWVLGKLKK